MKLFFQKEPVFKIDKYEGNEMQLSRLEEFLVSLQELEEKKYQMLKEDVNCLKNVIENSKSAREQTLDNNLDEFSLLERKISFIFKI